MANYTIDKVEYGSNTYNLQDNTSGYTKNTGTVTSVGITEGTGISVSGSPITTSGNITVGHSNSVTAGTVGTSSATTGNSFAIPYITYDAQGHITASGTHTETIAIGDSISLIGSDGSKSVTFNTSNMYRTEISITPTLSMDTTTYDYYPVTYHYVVSGDHSTWINISQITYSSGTWAKNTQPTFLIDARDMALSTKNTTSSASPTITVYLKWLRVKKQG